MKTRRPWLERLVAGARQVVAYLAKGKSAKELPDETSRQKTPRTRRDSHALFLPFGWPAVHADNVYWVLVGGSQMRWIVQDIRARRPGLGLTAKERDRTMFDQAVAIAKAEFPYAGVVKETLQFPELYVDRQTMDLAISGYSCHVAIALATWSAMGWSLKRRFCDTQILATGSFFGAKVGEPERVSDKEVHAKLAAFSKGNGLQRRRIMLFPAGNVTKEIVDEFFVQQVSDLATWNGREPGIFWVADIRVLHAALFEPKATTLAEQTSASPQWEITQATRSLLAGGKGAATSDAAPGAMHSISPKGPTPVLAGPHAGQPATTTATIQGSWSEQGANRSSRGTLTGSGELEEILRLLPNAKLQVTVNSSDGRRYRSTPHQYGPDEDPSASNATAILAVLAALLFAVVVALSAFLATHESSSAPAHAVSANTPAAPGPTLAPSPPTKQSSTSGQPPVDWKSFTPLTAVPAISGSALPGVPAAMPVPINSLGAAVATPRDESQVDAERALREWMRRNEGRGQWTVPQAAPIPAQPAALGP